MIFATHRSLIDDCCRNSPLSIRKTGYLAIISSSLSPLPSFESTERIFSDSTVLVCRCTVTRGYGTVTPNGTSTVHPGWGSSTVGNLNKSR